jgi:hypothetical protein
MFNKLNKNISKIRSIFRKVFLLKNENNYLNLIRRRCLREEICLYKLIQSIRWVHHNKLQNFIQALQQINQSFHRCQQNLGLEVHFKLVRIIPLLEISLHRLEIRGIRLTHNLSWCKWQTKTRYSKSSTSQN